MRPGNDTVTVLRAPLITDRYGAKVRDWAHASSTSWAGCTVQPYSATEAAVDREYAATHVRLFAPPGTSLLATDRVQHGGVTYDVDGDPALWAGHHLEASLKRTTG